MSSKKVEPGLNLPEWNVAASGRVLSWQHITDRLLCNVNSVVLLLIMWQKKQKEGHHDKFAELHNPAHSITNSWSVFWHLISLQTHGSVFKQIVFYCVIGTWSSMSYLSSPAQLSFFNVHWNICVISVAHSCLYIQEALVYCKHHLYFAEVSCSLSRDSQDGMIFKWNSKTLMGCSYLKEETLKVCTQMLL